MEKQNYISFSLVVKSIFLSDIFCLNMLSLPFLIVAIYFFAIFNLPFQTLLVEESEIAALKLTCYIYKFLCRLHQQEYIDFILLKWLFDL